MQRSLPVRSRGGKTTTLLRGLFGVVVSPLPCVEFEARRQALPCTRRYLSIQMKEQFAEDCDVPWRLGPGRILSWAGGGR